MSLTDKVAQEIGELSLGAGNYISVIELLEERYGNKQAQIMLKMEQLLRLTPVKTMNNVGGLRKLFDGIETSIRNFDALNVQAEHAGRS